MRALTGNRPPARALPRYGGPPRRTTRETARYRNSGTTKLAEEPDNVKVYRFVKV